jgi:hypothetical protein
VDDNHVSAYQNSDHAGTPEAFLPYVIGGATGGGGSNYTGSLSSTQQVTPAVLSSLSGFVLTAGTSAPESGVCVTLTWTNSLGQSVSLTTYTDTNGYYSFTGLSAGTYSIMETPPSGYAFDHDTPGSLNGTPGIDTISSIVLGSGANGVNYDFYNHLFAGS